MYIFLIVPTHIFEKLQQCGAMRPDTQKEWRGYTVSPNRICAAQLAGFPDEDGTVLALQVPTEEISLVDLTDEEERALTVVYKRQDIKAVLFPELCLSFVKGQDAFLNTDCFVTKPNISDLRKTGCEVLHRLLAKHPDGDTRYQSLCILAAGDFLVWKAGFVKLNHSDCAEFCMMIDGLFFSNDDAIAVELGIHPFGCRELAAYTVCNSVCRKYFALQDLATEKIDKKVAAGAIKFLERRSSCAPITVILRNTERSFGEDQGAGIAGKKSRRRRESHSEDALDDRSKWKAPCDDHLEERRFSYSERAHVKIFFKNRNSAQPFCFANPHRGKDGGERVALRFFFPSATF